LPLQLPRQQQFAASACQGCLICAAVPARLLPAAPCPQALFGAAHAASSSDTWQPALIFNPCPGAAVGHQHLHKAWAAFGADGWLWGRQDYLDGECCTWLVCSPVVGAETCLACRQWARAFDSELARTFRHLHPRPLSALCAGWAEQHAAPTCMEAERSTVESIGSWTCALQDTTARSKLCSKPWGVGNPGYRFSLFLDILGKKLEHGMSWQPKRAAGQHQGQLPVHAGCDLWPEDAGHHQGRDPGERLAQTTGHVVESSGVGAPRGTGYSVLRGELVMSRPGGPQHCFGNALRNHAFTCLLFLLACSYVEQTDVISARTTVKEALLFSGRLRLDEAKVSMEQVC
jgi:hypothetical protein